MILSNNPSQRPSLEVSLEISAPDSRSRKKNSLNEVCWTFSEETERLVGKKRLEGVWFFSPSSLWCYLFMRCNTLSTTSKAEQFRFFRFLAEAGARIFLNNPTFINSVFKNLVHLEKMGLDCGSGSFWCSLTLFVVTAVGLSTHTSCHFKITSSLSLFTLKIVWLD